MAHVLPREGFHHVGQIDCGRYQRTARNTSKGHSRVAVTNHHYGGCWNYGGFLFLDFCKLFSFLSLFNDIDLVTSKLVGFQKNKLGDLKKKLRDISTREKSV